MDNGSEQFQGFVNIRLESQDKKAIKTLAETTIGEDIWNFILSVLDDGYAISISPDFENDAVIATLRGKDGDDPNCGFAMSQRHSDPLIAMVALQFAHVEIAQRGTWAIRADDWRKVDW